MGARKRISADKRKEENKSRAVAELNNCPTSPRKMRYVVDMIRGIEVNRALDILRFSTKEPSKRIEKLLLSAISNWQKKHEDVRIEKSNLFVKEVFVDGGRMLKRLRPAPQGRGYRIRKRSNHVTIILDSLADKQEQIVSNTNQN
jgi:large subunit ribosomal protein L22